MFNLVKKQHKKFGLEYDGGPRHLKKEEKAFYVEALLEEVREYEESNLAIDEYDAILDILVFALGALQRHGFDPKGIEAVVEANMKKELGPLTKRGSFKLDLIKPEGWEPPDLDPYFICEQLDLPSIPKADKYDDGKPPIHLVDKEIIIELAKVLGYGANKYTANNWRSGLSFSRYYSACMRHLLSWNSGKDNDEESKLNHISHAATNLMFLINLMKNKPELDDRCKK